VLSSSTQRPNQFVGDGQRHFCRNPRCRSRLPTPVDNRRHAFCTLTCHRTFYFSRCVVCERRKRSAKAATCGRRCRAEQRRLPRAFPLPGQYPFRRRADTKSADKTGLKTPPITDRVWRHVGGPQLPDINYRVPLDHQTAGRVRRANDKFEQHRSRSVPLTLIGGGRRWPGVSLDVEVTAEILATEIGPISARSHSPLPPAVTEPRYIPLPQSTS
jgi:hypothetical protein